MSDSTPALPRVVRADELPWAEKASPSGASRFYRKKLGQAAGSLQLGCTLQRIPPRTRGWPLHYHLANEEAVYVLRGSGRVRLGAAEHAIRAGDYVAFPVGAACAHRVWNDGDEELEFLCVSTMREPDVVVYPDSHKIGVIAGGAPGTPDEAKTLERFLRGDAEMDYWDGEA